MDSLIAGYRRFRDGYYQRHEVLFRDLATRGQKPSIMMIACSDSRVDPAITFDTKAGDVFMVRNVANLVPPYGPNADFHGTSAALEFATLSLEVKDIVVLGHARCGGIATLMGAGPMAKTDFIEPWMQIAAPARERAKSLAVHHGHAPNSAHACQICEMEGVKVSLANLMTFPWIKERVAQGNLSTRGLYFDITDGTLQQLSGDTYQRIV